MTNKEVLNRMFDIDFDSSDLKITCKMLACSKCPRKDNTDCEPFIGDADITKEWLEMEWR